MELLNAKDVSKILRCSLPLIYKMADDGRLACVRWDCPGQGRLKTMVRFKKKDVFKFIENNYQKGETLN